MYYRSVGQLTDVLPFSANKARLSESSYHHMNQETVCLQWMNMSMEELKISYFLAFFNSKLYQVLSSQVLFSLST